MKPLKNMMVAFLIAMMTVQPAFGMTKVEVEGVAFERDLTARGESLELQGYGLLRYMIFIKAYVGALYLPPSVAPGDVLEPVAKRLELEYFHAIAKEDFDQATRVKIADNVTPFQLEQLQSRMKQLGAIYQDVQPGDRYSLTFVPGQGTELALNGKALGTIPGKDFARALFGVWLGANPIDDDFRDVLLGAR